MIRPQHTARRLLRKRPEEIELDVFPAGLATSTVPVRTLPPVPGADTAAITRRSLGIGLTLTALIAALTPYNDYLLQNIPLIGNHFPVGLLTVMALLVLAVNPLLQLVGWKRLATGELTVVMALQLVAAAGPSSGLVRYLEPGLMGPFRVLDGMPWLKPLANLLPNWAVPSHDPSSSLIRSYWLGVDAAVGEAVPVLAFIIPALCWSVLIAGIFGCAMFLAGIFRKQWVQHERLSYPLATIPLELLSAPEEGQFYNKLWRNPVLWAGVALPALVHLLSGVHQYVPSIPAISLNYDFSNAFTERPWDRLPHYLVANRIYLSVVGICFFIPAQVALSLWLFLVVNGLLYVLLSPTGIDPGPTEPLRGMGIYLGYFAGLTWIARRHLWFVLRSAWAGTQRDDAEFASYRTLVVGLAISGAVAWVWMCLFGIQPVLAALVLGLGLILATLMSRIVAETGLFFLGATWQIPRLMEVLLGPKLVGMGSFYLSSVVSRIFFGDLRETLMPYATTSLRLGADLPSRQRPRLFLWFFVAIALSVAVAGVSQHYLSYHFGREALRDEYATSVAPVQAMTDAHRFGTVAAPVTPTKAWTHFGLGMGMVAVLMFGRVMWASWPFHPIGLLLMNAWPLQVFWFSILVGWAIKQTMLHYGGAVLFRRARAFFIGLIVGEMLTAGFWLGLGLLTQGALKYKLFPG